MGGGGGELLACGGLKEEKGRNDTCAQRQVLVCDAHARTGGAETEPLSTTPTQRASTEVGALCVCVRL